MLLYWTIWEYFLVTSDKKKRRNSPIQLYLPTKQKKIGNFKPLIGDDLLKERLDIETLEALKVIAKKEIFNQKYIKIKTRLL